MITLTLTEEDAFVVLYAALTAILPAGFEVILGQVNRVPQTKADDYLVYWPMRRDRIATNGDQCNDALFTGAINGPVLTVSAVQYGKPTLKGPVFGVDVADGTYITGLTSVNPDGTGTYQVTPSQTVSVQTMAGGVTAITQPTKLTLQVDVHGPNSADNAQIISTLLRDEYGVNLFDPDTSGVSPLYADDPRQLAYTNEQNQVENRWMIEAVLQINPVVTIPQQYADVLDVTPINVDATYPS